MLRNEIFFGVPLRGALNIMALTVVALLTWLGSAPAAQAQDDRARLHFQAGASYYEAGDYEDALREFQRSQALSQRSELFYNFSLCYQQLGDLENAAAYLRRYLDEVETMDNRDQLERRYTNLQERIAAQAQQQADPRHDPNEGDPSQPPDAQTGTEATTTGDVPDATEPPAAPAARRGVPVGAVIGFAAAGVGVVLAVTFGPLALRERNSIEDGCGATRSCSPRDVQQMDGFALATDIGLVMAAAGATVGTVLLLTGRRDEPAPSDQARLRFTPYASPMGAGATLRGTF